MTPAPLITPISEPAGPEPTLAIIFNERSAPDQVADIVSRVHAFVEFEQIETVDEDGRPAYVLVITCETATADDLYSLLGHRLPDYVQARRFPPSRIPAARAAADSIRAAAEDAQNADGSSASPQPSSADGEPAVDSATGVVTPPSGIVLSRPSSQSQRAS